MISLCTSVQTDELLHSSTTHAHDRTYVYRNALVLIKLCRCADCVYAVRAYAIRRFSRVTAQLSVLGMVLYYSILLL